MVLLIINVSTLELLNAHNSQFHFSYHYVNADLYQRMFISTYNNVHVYLMYHLHYLFMLIYYTLACRVSSFACFSLATPPHSLATPPRGRSFRERSLTTLLVEVTLFLYPPVWFGYSLFTYV
jgi:hypothetical protein